MAAEDDVRVDHQAQGVAPPIINDDSRPSIARGRHSVLVLITDVHRGMIPALEYALSFGSDHITAVHVDLDSEITEQLRVQWQQWELAIPLVILPSPDRSLLRPVQRFVDHVTRSCADHRVTVVIPELVPARWWHHLLHNRPVRLLKAVLLLRKGNIVASVPYYLDH
jgi:hypothetical protein